jgi:monoterpene epsilon-lactone hydrolase
MDKPMRFGVRVVAIGMLTACGVSVEGSALAQAPTQTQMPTSTPTPTRPQTPKQPPDSQDSATFDSDGTAHITRVVPEPLMVSPEARKWLGSTTHDQRGPQTLEQRRAATDEWRARDSAEALKQYPVAIKETTIGGVKVDSITPLQIPQENLNRVLINLHGGGFNSDSGSRIEGDPIANLAKMRVVGVYYRLAPEHPFPAAVDDVVAVYKELMKTYKPGSIGIFGTSAGGILACEVAVKLKQLGLPVPGAMAILSALGDFSRVSDSRQLFTLDGFPGTLGPTDSAHLPNDPYVGKADRRDPVLSPVFADLGGMPPTLFISGTRDLLLGDTSTLHRAMLHAGVDARLVVFEALPHAFWYHFEFPETREALQLTADFLAEKVAR